MSDLTDLYQEVILDHNRRPRNFRVLEKPSHHAEGYNPLCGDRLDLFISVDTDRIADIGFQGSGCAISKASASLMTDAVKGRSLAEVRDLFTRFHRMVTTPPDRAVEDLGKLSVLAGVREFPVRVKCASLAWHTLKAALDREEEDEHGMKPLPMAPPPAVETPASTTGTNALVPDAARTAALSPAILDAIRTVFDPEIPVNIVELGLIYEVFVDAAGVAAIRMTLTAPGCPAAQSLPVEVAQKVKAVPGVADARVDIVWEPGWTKDRMSDVAKLQLGLW